jgi:hypothetical protein
MQYNNIETYTYTVTELIKNSQIMDFKPRLENKKSFIQNTNATLYENINNIAGKIIYINNFTQIDGSNFNTSIGTIITDSGKLVFNLSYEIFTDSFPFLDTGKILETKATYKSGKYDNKLGNDVLITIQSLNDLYQTRILTIQY